VETLTDSNGKKLTAERRTKRGCDEGMMRAREEKRVVEKRTRV
jgi:hypothetical protein